MLPKNHLCIRRLITRCVAAALLTLGPSLLAEDYIDVDTVGRLGVALGYGSLTSLDQSANASLLSQPGYVLTPALDVGLYRHWLLTMESQLRMMKWNAPLLAGVTQDPGVTTNATVGIHFRTDPVELGFLTGLGESSLIAGAPSTGRIVVQNIFTPYIGFRLGLNGRYRRFYTRIEASYYIDFPANSDRSSLQILQGSRWMINGQLGIGRYKEWLRFTGGVGIQNANTDIGRQSSIILMFGISIGRIWGQKPSLEAN